MSLRFTVRYLPTSSIAARMKGTVKAKRTRQWLWSMMRPEMVGPMAGATVNIMVMTPIAVPHRRGG